MYIASVFLILALLFFKFVFQRVSYRYTRMALIFIERSVLLIQILYHEETVIKFCWKLFLLLYGDGTFRKFNILLCVINTKHNRFFVNQTAVCSCGNNRRQFLKRFWRNEWSFFAVREWGGEREGFGKERERDFNNIIIIWSQFCASKVSFMSFLLRICEYMLILSCFCMVDIHLTVVNS